MGMDEVAEKAELHNPEGSCSSSGSTPEPDGEVPVQEESQRQKRKGGRKPVCPEQNLIIICDSSFVTLVEFPTNCLSLLL